MTSLNLKCLCILLSLMLALVPASLLAKADNCCPDVVMDCHAMNMACAQCLPAAISITAAFLPADTSPVAPESIQTPYIYPPGHSIWRPPTSV